MSDNRSLALAAKGRGNAHFSKGEYKQAIDEFTKAIELDPTDHVFYSNRSGSHAGLKQYEQALADALKCIKAKPSWAKGFTRKGLALFELGKLDEAAEAYEEGLALAPTNQSLKDGLASVMSAKSQASNPMAAMFSDATVWPKLMADPNTRAMCSDPAFVQKIKLLQTNPQMLGSMGSDPQLSAAIGVILGLGSNFGGQGPGAGEVRNMGEMKAGKPAPASSETKDDSDDEEMPDLEVEEEELDPVEAKKKADAKLALEKKVEGNAFFKKKKLDEALALYQEATQLDPANATYVLNIAAVLSTQKKYKECIEQCHAAIALAQKSGDYSSVGKAYFRIGNAYTGQKDYTQAIEFYQKSLLEDNVYKVRNQLQKVKRAQEKAEKEAYLDDEKSDQAKARGNEFYKSQKWVDAIKEYTEALKRNPKNYKVYSNRAACYSKLMDWQSGLKDCEACLEIDPKFVKAYIRKGKIQHFLKQYHKAIGTFQQGLAIQADSTELIEGLRTTQRAIAIANQSGQADPERQKRAMADPEIQAILRDPTINRVLQDMQNNPKAAQRYMKDPVISSKINTLIQAGVLKVG